MFTKMRKKRKTAEFRKDLLYTDLFEEESPLPKKKITMKNRL